MLVEKNKLKKIEIKRTNNEWFKRNMDDFFINNSIDLKSLDDLQEYVSQKVSFTANNELDLIIEIMTWVSSQWKHDGLNEPPKGTSALQILRNVHEQNMCYRCAEYGFVLSEVLKAFGLISRSISLRTVNVAYGGYGSGHVASEIWVNELKKWIFVDPQFCIIPFHQGEPLNYLEMFTLKKSDNLSEIEFRIPESYQKLRQIRIAKFSQEYREFIAEYFGTIGIKTEGFFPGSSLHLLLEAEKQFMTFQGFGFNKAIFTSNPEELYFPMNNSMIVFSFHSDEKTFADKVKALDIKNEKQYLEQMPNFAAKPSFKIALVNNSILHSHYQISIDSQEWKKNETGEINWNLKDGMNTIEVKSINHRGIAGPITFVEIVYS